MNIEKSSYRRRERGSGIDKVISEVEAFQLPAPDFRVAGDSTVAVLYGPRKFAQMDREERVRAYEELPNLPERIIPDYYPPGLLRSDSHRTSPDSTR